MSGTEPTYTTENVAADPACNHCLSKRPCPYVDECRIGARPAFTQIEPDGQMTVYYTAEELCRVVNAEKAEAWNEGHGTTCDGITSSLDGCEKHNPYRSRA